MKRKGKPDRTSGRGHRKPGPELTVVPVSCPDCAGVLSAITKGPASQRLYICQINHRHSITSLYRAMEERLENTLWTATVIMKQINGVYQQLLTEQQRRPADATAKNIKRRLRELEAQRVAIRDIIVGTHVIEST